MFLEQDQKSLLLPENMEKIIELLLCPSIFHYSRMRKVLIEQMIRISEDFSSREYL